MKGRREGQLYWDRMGWVEIEGYGKPPVGLDFRFDIEKIGDIYATFNVGVLGLNSSNINALTVWNPVDAVTEGREIRVFAGYKGMGDGKIPMLCRGIVFNALPTPPPEMWMNFECILTLKQKDPVIGVEPMYNKKIGEIADKICSLMGYTFFWKAVNTKEDKIGSFDFSGSKDTMLNRFAEDHNLIAILGDNNDVYFYDRKAWNMIPLPPPVDIPVINTNSGLLMVGNVTVAGATIRVRLNDTYGIYSWVRLESKLIPRANGFYFVLSKHHKGHLRGEEWYTELELIRKG